MKRKQRTALLLSLVLACTFAAAGLAEVKTTPAGELPILTADSDKVTLTLGVVQYPFIADYETNYFVRWVEEQTGVDLNFVMYPSDNANDKVLLTLSTGDTDNLPDVFLRVVMGTNNTIFGASYAARWYDEGMIIPLNGLIDEYGFNYKSTAETAAQYGYEIRKWSTSPDGSIYFLPSFSASLTNTFPEKMWINQSWLDNLGLSMPATTEEFREVLRAFKEKDPNQNGLADEIPLSGAKQALYYAYDYLINAFIYNDTYNSRMYVEDGTVKFAPTTGQWREAMKYLRSLNDEGLFYSGTFTQDTTTLTQIALNENNVLGCFEGLGHDLVLTTSDQDVLDRWTYMPALTGPDGAHFVSYAAPGVSPGAVITTKCEYPEIAMRVLDAMMSYEGSLITRYGEKGVNWDDATPGSIGYYGTPAFLKIMQNTWAQAGQNQNFLQLSPYILDPAIATGIEWGGDVKEAGYIKAMAVKNLQTTGVIPTETLSNLVFTSDETEVVQSNRTDIDSYILQSIANFVAGDWDPSNDAQWEKYKAEFDHMGLADYLNAVQTCYTRMNAQ